MDTIRRGILSLALLGIFSLGTGFTLPSVPTNLAPSAPATLPAASGKLPDVLAAPLPAELVDQLGVLAYRMAIRMHTASASASDQALVDRVTQRLVAAANGGRYAAVARGFRWEAKVVQAPDVNAAAFPGGKIVVDDALLDFTGRREDDLAVALGHEIVHALARHAAQRFDRELRQEIALAAAGKQLSEAGLSPAAASGLMVAMGLAGEGAVMRPFSRDQESEADHEGLLLLARAGYDPQAAVRFWENRKLLPRSGGLPSLFTSHPSDEARLEQMRRWMPEALSGRATDDRRQSRR